MTARSRSDEKAQAILNAARRCLSERGYAAATIAEIAAEAGVSRGLLHYYFRSKEELLAQVVRAGTDAYMELLGAMFAQCESADDLAKQLVVATRTIVESDPTFVNLSMECWTLAHESPLVAHELEDLYRQLRDAVREGLEEAKGRGIITTAIPLGPLSALLLAITDGLVMQLLIHPQLAADERMWEALELAARSLLGTGERNAEVST
jgi:AcrR family transcriptional regulator